MDLHIERIENGNALMNRELILPTVYEGEDFDRYICYGAFDEEEPVGILVLDQRNTEPEILSICVDDGYRNMGIGSALLKYAVYDSVKEYGSKTGTDNRFVCQIAGGDESDAIRSVVTRCGFLPKKTAEKNLTRYTIEFLDLLADPGSRFTDDMEFVPVDNDRMVCAECKHCTTSILECGKYLQKPDAVLDGGECKLFGKR